MKLNKNIAEYIASRKKHEAYWVEQAKLDFSIQLESYRKKAGLSYTDLAKKLGTSTAYVSKIFRGDANLTLESMVKLSRATGGKVNIRIIEETQTINKDLWFATIKHLPAANHRYNVISDNSNVTVAGITRFNDIYEAQAA